MNKLRPCPFCGRRAELRHNNDGFSYIVCANDGCYVRTDGHLNDESAIEHWNRRDYDDEPSVSSTRRILTEVSIDHNNRNMLWVRPSLYEFIKNNPDEIIVEAQCRPPIILKTVGVKDK